MTEKTVTTKRHLVAYALISIACWCVAVWLAWTVSPRLALAAFIGSIAFNLSAWVGEQARGRR